MARTNKYNKDEEKINRHNSYNRGVKKARQAVKNCLRNMLYLSQDWEDDAVYDEAAN